MLIPANFGITSPAENFLNCVSYACYISNDNLVLDAIGKPFRNIVTVRILWFSVASKLHLLLNLRDVFLLRDIKQIK